MTKTKQEYIDSIPPVFQDSLQNIMLEQTEFLSNFIVPNLATDAEKIAYSKEYILAAMRELGEVLNELPWKMHRPNSKEISVDHVHEEIIDVLKFVLNIGIIWGMDAKALKDMFMYKSAVVRERLSNEKDSLK